MSSEDDMKTDSVRQVQKDNLLSALVSVARDLLNLVTEMMGHQMRPAIVAHGLYTREQVKRYLHVSDATIAIWVEFNKLTVMQPGTSAMFFLGADIIEFMKAHKDGVFKPKDAQEKAALRKQGAK